MYINLIKVPITSVGILHICNLWILLNKIVIYLNCNCKIVESFHRFLG